MIKRLGEWFNKSMDQAMGTALGVALITFVSYTTIGVSTFYSVNDDMVKGRDKLESQIESSVNFRSNMTDRQTLLKNELIKMVNDRIDEYNKIRAIEIKTTNDNIASLKQEILELNLMIDQLKGSGPVIPPDNINNPHPAPQPVPVPTIPSGSGGGVQQQSQGLKIIPQPQIKQYEKYKYSNDIDERLKKFDKERFHQQQTK